MSGPLRVCLFDEVKSTSSPFASAFEKVMDLEIIDVFSSWEPMQACLLLGNLDIVVVNLDSPSGLDVVQRINKHASQCPIIGVSSKTDSGFIIQAMRAGCGQFVCAPIDPEDLNNAIQRIRPLRSRTAQSSKRICVVGSSGGSGATTIACNLAMEMGHLTGRRVALVDLNLEYGDVCCAFDCSPKYSISDICAEHVDLDHETLTASLHELPCNISILGRPERLEDARDVTPEGVELMFRMLAERFAHVIVDLPRTYNFLSAVAVGRAEAVLIVAQLTVPHIRNATRIYQCLAQMGASEDRLHIILNRFNAEYDRITTKDVEEHFHRPVFAIIPNDYQFVSAALDLGHPLGADSPSSRARAAIQEMARKLAPEFAGTDAVSSSGNLLSKLLGRKQKQQN